MSGTTSGSTRIRRTFFGLDDASHGGHVDL
jgi:hypothetical protein